MDDAPDGGSAGAAAGFADGSGAAVVAVGARRRLACAIRALLIVVYGVRLVADDAFAELQNSLALVTRKKTNRKLKKKNHAYTYHKL